MLLPKSFIWLIIGMFLLLIAIGGWQWTQYLQRSSLCESPDYAALSSQYPALGQLILRHRHETMQLLNQQHAQDIMLNMQMRINQQDLEVTLQQSRHQVDELASLRQRQRADFLTLCQQLVNQ